MKSTFLKKWLFLMVGIAFLCHPPLEAYGVEPGYPWSPPYTAEQIMYLCDAVQWTGGIEKAYKTADMNAISIQVDARGYIRQNPALRRRKNYFANYGEILDYTSEKLKVGEPRNKDIVFIIYPPALRGQAVVDWKYKQEPGKYKPVDFWVYVPALKMVRRLATGDRADGFAGGDMTYDDIYSLEPFDETHTLIGEDILPPGAVCPSEPRACYVVKSINRNPNYYLSKRLRWVDKETFIPWREEQYDKKGYLRVIFEKKMEKIQGYTVQTLWNYWNIQRDFRQPVFIFDYRFDKPMSEAEFNYDYLRKEFAWRNPSLKEFPFIKNLGDLPPRPTLLRDRFPEERKIKLPEELERELKEGRLK